MATDSLHQQLPSRSRRPRATRPEIVDRIGNELITIERVPWQRIVCLSNCLIIVVCHTIYFILLLIF